MILLVLFSFCACDIDKIEGIDISNIKVDFLVKRFDIDYYTAINGNIYDLKNKYPYFFPQEITDSITLSKINNKDEQELFSETQRFLKISRHLKNSFQISLSM